MNPDLRELEVFRRVMELGSVTAAAAALNVSQPAVSRTLAQAEHRLGFPLFTRQRKRLIPTAEAQAMFPETLRAFAALDVVRRLAEDLRAGRAGVLTVATIPSLANAVLPEAIHRFRLLRPEASVALHTYSAHEVALLVAGHRADLGLVIGPVATEGLVVQDLRATEVVCVLPPDHPLAARPAIGPRDLADVPLICPGRHLVIGEGVARAFAEAEVPLRIGVEVPQSMMACALVRSGAGIALLDGFGLAGARASDLVSRPFRPAIPSVARLLRARLRPLPRLAQEFVQSLHGSLGVGVPVSADRRGRAQRSPLPPTAAWDGEAHAERTPRGPEGGCAIGEGRTGPAA
ncbi:LysR substrate-binding domain-containing protein [Muricoccus radiodurans]|uniref:LysR substrate-binding domain-containing protein n=1 Tax=Muricoccus radiodurans TaxID=2231721 RepID=UPI003CE77C54